MNNMLWLFYGFALEILVDRLFMLWRRSEDLRKKKHAAKILKEHGLTPQLYLATIGEKDHELCYALDVFALTGNIITDAKGNVVGKLCPKSEKKPYLRLVVSND